MALSRVPYTTPAIWHVVDAKNQVLGRIAPQIAKLLMGKHKPTFAPHVDAGDFVVVINAADVALTGKKRTTKLYKWHTGWMGGLKTLTARQMFEKDPARVIEHAVKGMIPPNRLRDDRMRRLRVFSTGEHPHERQVKQSAAYAPAYLAAVAPADVQPRARVEGGILVKDATPEQLSSLTFQPLEHDEAFASRFLAYREGKAARMQQLQDAVDERILIRAKLLEEEEAAAAKAAAAGVAAGGKAGARPPAAGGGGKAAPMK